MNSLGEYRLIQYTGSQLEAIQHFSFSQIPHEIIDPLTPRLQILEHPYLSSDCKILSINDIIYRMVPAPFTKMMNVNFTTNASSISKSRDRDTLYAIANKTVYKYNITSDSLLASYRLAALKLYNDDGDSDDD